jgi:carboxyl-terminal processing protease
MTTSFRSLLVLVFGAGASAALADAAAAQQRPAVVALVPAHLASGVSPARVRLVVTFDRDMDSSRHAVSGGGASFPRVARTAWPTARTFALDVELTADTVYSLELAAPGTSGFRGTDGGVLAPTSWRFATAGEPLRAGVAAAAVTKLFASIRDHYSYRDRIGVDWVEVERTRGAALRAAADGPALALLVADLLAQAQDPHVTVRWRDGSVPTWRREVATNFDQRGLQRALRTTRVGRSALAARTEDGIGYLLVPSFAREQREEFELLLQALRGMLDCKALVLDVRPNGGGDEQLARRLAAFFVTGDVVYAKHRVRDPLAADGFRPVEARSLRGNAAPDVFPRPVAVLQGPLNMSTCEAFLLMMKQAPQAILVGSDSYGSSGNPQPHTLAPGLAVMLPSWQALRADGTPFEGEGIAPHVHVDVDPERLATEDQVLQAALSRLRSQR